MSPLLLLVSSFVFAAEAPSSQLFCKGMQLSNGFSEVVLAESGNGNSDGFYSSSGKIGEVYFSVQGIRSRNLYSLNIRLPDPKPNGTGIYSDGAFDNEGFLRLSVVFAGSVFKIVCSNKGPFDSNF